MKSCETASPLQTMLGGLFEMTPKQAPETILNRFATLRVVHSVELAWWWTNGAEQYDSKVRDKISASIEQKAKKLADQYDVTLNSEYRCQFDGLEFKGDDPEKLKKVALELSAHLAKFDCIIPLI